MTWKSLILPRNASFASLEHSARLHCHHFTSLVVPIAHHSTKPDHITARGACRPAAHHGGGRRTCEYVPTSSVSHTFAALLHALCEQLECHVASAVSSVGSATDTLPFAVYMSKIATSTSYVSHPHAASCVRVLTLVGCGFLVFARSSSLPKDTPLFLHAHQPQTSSAASCAVHSSSAFSFVRLFIPSFMPPRSSQQAARRRAAQARHTRRAPVSRVPDPLMPHTAPALPARNTAAQAAPRGGSATPPQVPQRTTGTAPAGVSPSTQHTTGTTMQQCNNTT